jgi:hypothetical protein
MARTSSNVESALSALVRLIAPACARSLMWLSTSLADAYAILQKCSRSLPVRPWPSARLAATELADRITFANRLQRCRNSHHERDGVAGSFESLFMGNEVGVGEGVGHGHLRVVHILANTPVQQPMSGVRSTGPLARPALDFGCSPAIPRFERPGGGHYGLTHFDHCPLPPVAVPVSCRWLLTLPLAAVPEADAGCRLCRR